jgi:hypothetical protein
MRLLHLLSLAPIVAGGCSRMDGYCTEMGCSGSLDLVFEAESWAEGDYQVTMDVGGDYLERCRFTIPLSEPNPRAGSSCWVAPTFDGTRLSVSMPTPGDDSLVEVVVVLLVDDKVVFEETLAPEWGEPFYPNGEACDGDEGYGCLSGEETIEL